MKACNIAMMMMCMCACHMCMLLHTLLSDMRSTVGERHISALP